MQVHVRLFAALRDAAGVSSLSLRLEPGATAETAWLSLVAAHPGLAVRRPSLAAAVNRRHAPFDTPLAEGDEVVFLPPVSGG